MQTDNQFIEILKQEVVLALGCTEPVAVALASAWAARAIGKPPASITVWVDKNIYKNGLGVGVPGTGSVGLHIAAAAGAIAGDPTLRLEVLRPITAEDVLRAQQLVAANRVSIQIELEAHDVYVEAVVNTEGLEGRASIRQRHDHVIAVTCNGQPFVGFAETGKHGTPEEKLLSAAHPIQQFTLEQIFDFIQHAPFEQLHFLRAAVETNRVFAENSLKQDALVGVGAKIQQLIAKGWLSNDFIGKTKRLVASAVEARMAGVNVPVMSCAGSGNQGLISTLPVVVMVEYISASEEQLLRAAALSYLLTVYVKSFMGVLTPVCGGNVAGGVGVACALTYLLGGQLADIERAVKNMAGSVMGVICDGAKIGCALKSTMAVSVAIDSALLALEGVAVPTGDGIVEESADQTIRNMGFVTTPGMSQTDDAILKVMAHQHQ